MRPVSFVLPLVLALASTARADLKAAADLVLHGDYAGAVTGYRAVKGKDAARAQVHLGRALLTTGDLAAARAAADGAAKAGLIDGRVLGAEIDRAAGRYAEA